MNSSRVLWVLLWALFSCGVLAAQGTGVRIDGLSPSPAQVGDLVRVTGVGFGGGSLVLVTVGGRPASVLTARGASLVFVVPEGLTPGTYPVIVSNPGLRIATVGIEIVGANASLLPGDPNGRALDAVYDLSSPGVPSDEIVDGIFLSRLDVVIHPDALVGDVNAALSGVQAQLVSMSTGSPFVTVSIPRASDRASLENTRSALAASQGILAALSVAQADTKELPPSTDSAQANHLLATRFPAAWNVRQLIVDDNGTCRAARPVPILIADHFGEVPDTYGSLGEELPYLRLSAATQSEIETHGYDVAITMAAAFDSAAPVGANPFNDCLRLIGVPLANQTGFQKQAKLAEQFPTEPFLINVSIGWGNECEGLVCTTNEFISNPKIPRAVFRAIHTIEWKQLTRFAWERFLMFGASGNERNSHSAQLYPALGDGRFVYFTHMVSEPDPFFATITNADLWQSDGWPSLAATDEEVATVNLLVSSLGLDTVGGASNVARVGASSNHPDANQVELSVTSNRGATMHTVGYDIPKLEGQTFGTSFASPQAAGLASYLWLLGDVIGVPLRDRPMTETLDLIVRTSRTTPNVPNLIDAYAAVLELDRLTTGMPIRTALLDVNQDQYFDHIDLPELVQALGVGDATADPFPAADYSRHDLNGDGTTGGRIVARFDLNADGLIGEVDVQIEDRTITMNEAAVNDQQVLCYYAYSPVYRSAPDTIEARTDVLGLPACALVVDPPAVTLTSGTTQQFTATVGTDSAVTWSTSACSISDTGLFTACASAITATVRATSVDNPSLYAEATVTIEGGEEPPSDSWTGTVVQRSYTRSETVLTDSETGATGLYTVDFSEEVTWSIVALESLARPDGTVRYRSAGESLWNYPDGSICSNRSTSTADLPIGGYSDATTTATTGGYFYATGTITQERIWSCRGDAGSETTTQPFTVNTAAYNGFAATRPTYVFDGSGRVVALTWDFHYTDPRVLVYETSVTGRVDYNP